MGNVVIDFPFNCDGLFIKSYDESDFFSIDDIFYSFQKFSIRYCV